MSDEELLDGDILTPEEYAASEASGYAPPSKKVKGSWEDDWNAAAWYTSGSSSRSSWWDWGGRWTGSTYNFDSIEQKLKREKAITKALTQFREDNKIIAKTYITSDTSITRKSGIYSLSIENTKQWKSKLSFLQSGVDTWKKLPTSQRVRMNTPLLSSIINAHTTDQLPQLFNNTQLRFDGNYAEIDRLINLIRDTLNKPLINDEDVANLIDSIPPDVKKDLEDSQSHGWVSNMVDNFRQIPKMKKDLKITQPPNRFKTYAHLSKGKRINKWFIQKTDYKALRVKEKILTKKNKLLVLLDASWSMSGTSYNVWVNFIWALMRLNLFDVEVYHTTDRRVTNATLAMENWNSGKSNDQFVDTENAEWFESLTMRLASLPRDEKYVLVITDMCVPDDAEANLKAFIGAKKHLILSFGNKWRFGMNVRLVKKYEDMMAVTHTLLS